MRHIAVIAAFAAAFVAPAAFAAAPAAEEDIQYETITQNKVKCDVGILYTETEEGMEIKVAAVTTGKGSDFRKWEPTDIKLETAGEAVRPSSTEKSWGGEASFFRLPAAFVFAAIGTQYERYGSECSSGGTCPVTGQSTGSSSSHPGYKGSAAQAIDKAGMAAGMGLLTAQAKGEIMTFKAYFPLSRERVKELLSGELRVKVKSENKDKNDVRKADIDISKQFADFVKRHPGAEHKGGVPAGGTFILVNEAKEGEKKEAKAEEKAEKKEEKEEGKTQGEHTTAAQAAPQYFKGQAMTDSDLTRSQDYVKDKLKPGEKVEE